MAAPTDLPPLAATLRRHDPDRYLAALFAPAERRPALFALYAFNYEVAKTREVVTEPLLGRIRLQWWREALDGIYGGGRVRRHEVVEPLADAVRAFGLSRALFDRLLDAREFDLAGGPPSSLAALELYCEGTSSTLVALALEALGAAGGDAAEAGRQVGLGFALSGLLRGLPFHARAKRSYLPEDLTEAAGLDPRDLFELRSTKPLRQVVEQLAQRAREHLEQARGHVASVPRAALPALLPARAAGFDLRRLARAGYDPFAAVLARPDGLRAWRYAAAALFRRY